MDTYLQLQELVLTYFEKVDDKTMSMITDCFVYGDTTDNEKVSKLFEKFLSDNGLTMAYANYIYDMKNTTNYFRRSSSSETSMIEQIKLSFLNISHNRFRKLVSKEVKEVKLVDPYKVKMIYHDEDQHEEVHVVSDINSEYTLCGCLIDIECDSIYGTKEKVSCEYCKDVVNQCKKIKI